MKNNKISAIKASLIIGDTVQVLFNIANSGLLKKYFDDRGHVVFDKEEVVKVKYMLSADEIRQYAKGDQNHIKERKNGTIFKKIN